MVYYDDGFGDLPSAIDLMEVIRPMVVIEDPEQQAPGSSSPWYFAALMSDYRRGSFQQLSHFMPLFCKTHMGAGTWTTLSHSVSRKMSKRLNQFAASLPAEDESEDEFSASAKEHLMLLQRQKLFFDVMQKIDFLPSVVPGDGNCALWSILALMGGPVQKDPESSDVYRKRRKKTQR